LISESCTRSEDQPVVDDELGQPASLFVIDDDEALVDVCRLQTRRHQAFTFAGFATTAREGFDIIGDLRPNIVLVDLSLPDADGRSVMPQLAVTFPETMVAALTAREAEQAEAEVLATGAFAYYEKSMLIKGRLFQYLAQDLSLFRRALRGEDVVAPSALARRSSRGADPEVAEGLAAG